MSDQPSVVPKKRRTKAEIVAAKAACIQAAEPVATEKVKKQRKKKELPATAVQEKTAPTSVPVVEAAPEVTYTKPTRFEHDHPVNPADYGTLAETPPELPKTLWQKFKEAIRF